MAYSDRDICKVIQYGPQLSAQWDYFINNDSRNGCIFHERTFLSYHREGKFDDASLIFLHGNKLAGVLPAAAVSTDGLRSIVSHPGSSAGGLVYHKKSRLRDVLAMLEKSIEFYRDAGNTSLELRLAEPVFSFPTDGELPYLLWHRGFSLKTREISSCVNLQAEESWHYFGRKNNTNAINRAIKSGIRIIRDGDPAQVYRLIADNLNERHHKTPTHSLEELIELKQRYPEKLDFWAALLEDKLVAAIVTFAANRRTVHDFYIAQDYRLAGLQVMPLLFQTVFNHFRQTGYEWFNFGISSRADWIKWGILEFKEGMGGRATCRDTWLLENLQAYQACRNNEE